MRGVAVMNPRDPSIVYHHLGATVEVDGGGALSMPDEITSIELGQEGYAWFPTLSGAVRVGNSQAVVFGESRGVRGEVVSDIVVGLRDRVWLAAAEGVGYYENQRFEFRLPGEIQALRPIALAIDLEGNLWGAGPRGVAFHDSQSWSVLGEAHGLPFTEFRDVEVDAGGRVWLLGASEILIFTRQNAASVAES
jgi:ligand-binding sensor domain-containing protein